MSSTPVRAGVTRHAWRLGSIGHHPTDNRAKALLSYIMPAIAKNRRDASRGGFSLIELLVVVSIIALLIAVLLPVLGGMRRRARMLEGLSNLSQIGRGLAGYAMDFEDTLPVGWLHDGLPGDTNWTTLLNGHFMGAAMTDAELDLGRFSDIFKAPNAALDAGRVHFSAHPVLMPDLTRTSLPGYRTQRIARPAELVVVMDGCQVPPFANSNATAWQLDNLGLWDAQSRPIYYDSTASDLYTPIEPGPDEDSLLGQGHVRWRQPGAAANFLFGDGHVTTHRDGQLTKANVRADP